jgi:hypothetical protein
LAIADDQVLRLRTRELSAVDQTKIAHAAERVVARVARGGLVVPR